MSDLRSMLASLPQSDSRTLPPDTLELFEQLLEAAPDAWKIDLTAPPDVSGHSPQQQADLAVLCVRIAHGARGKPELERAFKLALVLLPPLLRAELPFSGNDLLWAVEACNVHAFTSAQWPVDAVLNALAHQVENEPLTEALSRELRTLQGFCGESDRAQWNRCREAVTELLDGRRAAYAPDVVDAWTLALRRAIVGDASAGSAAQPDAWRDLLQYCSTAKGSKPSKRWLKQAREHIEPVGVGAFVGVMQAVLDAVGTKAPFPVTSYRWGADNPIDGDPTTVDETRADQLRGLIWACLAVADDAPIEAVGDAAERCFQKVPMHGPRAPKVGNACTYVLSELPVPRAVSRLSRLATKVKHASTRKTVEKALQRAADREGITPLDLEEMAVPTYGFTEPGHRVDVLGDFEAELTTNGTNVTLSFRDQDGKVRKSVPVAVKRDFAEQLKALRKTVKELRTMAGPWRARLERMLLTERTLSVKAWNERYAHHPALAPLTRRLLWTVGDETVVFDGEQWNDLEGKAVEPEPDHVVKLWHPLDSPTDVVKAWRARLDELGITQPFKQAHREIYVLTDAERATGTYSNRFAAHVIRQHLFHALCRERGWKSVFLGPFDSDGGVPHKGLSGAGLARGILGGRHGPGGHQRRRCISLRVHGPGALHPHGRPSSHGPRRRGAPRVERDLPRRGPLRFRNQRGRRSHVGRWRPKRGIPGLLVDHGLRRAGGNRQDATRGPATSGAPIEHRRPLPAHRAVSGGPRRPSHLPHPRGLGKYSHGTGQSISVHRPGPQTHGRRRQGAPALRRRFLAVLDPEQSVPLGSRSAHQRSHHSQPNPTPGVSMTPLPPPRAVHIIDETVTGRELRRVRLELLCERLTVRELIEQRVRDEVTRYNTTRHEQPVFQGLIQPEAAERELNGFRMRKGRAVDADEQCRRALDAFRQNGFFVLVGDRQVSDLDEEVMIVPELQISFVQLMPLVGG